jgi:hypothetical protein
MSTTNEQNAHVADADTDRGVQRGVSTSPPILPLRGGFQISNRKTSMILLEEPENHIVWLPP